MVVPERPQIIKTTWNLWPPILIDLVRTERVDPNHNPTFSIKHIWSNCSTKFQPIKLFIREIRFQKLISKLVFLFRDVFTDFITFNNSKFFITYDDDLMRYITA